MYLFFVYSYIATQIEKKKKNERESSNEIKEEFFKSLIDS